MTAVALALLLLVRTYDGGGVAAADLDTGRRVAGAILENAGVGVAWLVCPPAPGAWLPNPPCAAAPRANEVLVRLASVGRAPAIGEHVLGNAYIDAGKGAGSLATLYVDRIDAIAARAGLAVGTVLGRAMAHEIGHLLLGHSRHRDRGLMRAYWSDTVLQSRLAGDWMFLREDARAMVRNLAVREQPTEWEPMRPAQE
jgi:hypothetical protein